MKIKQNVSTKRIFYLSILFVILELTLGSFIQHAKYTINKKKDMQANYLEVLLDNISLRLKASCIFRK